VWSPYEKSYLCSILESVDWTRDCRVAFGTMPSWRGQNSCDDEKAKAVRYWLFNLRQCKAHCLPRQNVVDKLVRLVYFEASSTWGPWNNVINAMLLHVFQHVVQFDRKQYRLASQFDMHRTLVADADCIRRLHRTTRSIDEHVCGLFWMETRSMSVLTTKCQIAVRILSTPEREENE
jgi:hypothetical protein